MLPKKALEYIDRKAIEFFDKLEVKPFTKSKKITVKESSLDHLPSVELKDEDVIDRINSTVDHAGNPLSFNFIEDGEEIGLSGQKHAEYFKFIEDLSQRKEFRQKVSLKKIDEAFIDWFRNLYQNKEFKEKASDFVLTKIKKSISKNRLIFPIQHLSISSSFSIGKTLFSYFRKQDFDLMEKEFVKIHGEEKINPLKKHRKYFQGCVTANVIVQAEIKKAMEIGLTEVKKSLAVLRFFSPSAFNTNSNSIFCLHQLNYSPSYHFFSFKENESLPTYTAYSKIDSPFFWSIGDKEMNRLRRGGMYHFDQLLREDELTEFDEILINSLFLFEKALLAEEQQEKLVYLITCLETLLLRDSGEPIKKSVSQRLSFLITDKKDERKKIIKTISAAHKERSLFIHHGQKKIISDEIMQDTQISLWSAINRMTAKKEKFNTKMEFIDFVDDEILSGNLRL